jgi:ATP-dependent DNA helicase HFM1/MER3
VAIILCETEQEYRYKTLTSAQTIVESCLHTNLIEHLNAEIGLRTVSNVDSAKHWLRTSFFFQRLQRNPAHYSAGLQAGQSWQDWLDTLVCTTVKTLQESGLVSLSEDGKSLLATELGEIMNKVGFTYIPLATLLSCLATSIAFVFLL